MFLIFLHPCLGLPWVPEGLFSCCLRQKLSDKAVIITIAASLLNVRRKQQGKKPSGTQGTLGSEAPTKKYKNAGRRERWLFAQTKGGKMLHVAYRD